MALGSASPVGSFAALAVPCACVIAGEGSAQTDSSLDPHETPNMLQALNRHNLIGLGFDRLVEAEVNANSIQNQKISEILISQG